MNYSALLHPFSLEFWILLISKQKHVVNLRYLYILYEVKFKSWTFVQTIYVFCLTCYLKQKFEATYARISFDTRWSQ